MWRWGDLWEGVGRQAFGRLTPVHRALLAVVRPAPDPEYRLDEVSRLDEAGRAELVGLLRRHGLGGWAYRVYRDAGVELPEDVLGPLRIEHASGTARNIVALSAYERLSGILSKAGVEHIPLKGIRLLETLYPDPGTRQIGDIDLLIREEDIIRADAALRAAGYRGEEPDYWRRQERYHNHHSYDAPPPFPVHVEVHWRLSSNFGVRWRGEWPWDRSSASEREGSTERVLDAATELTVLAIHAAKHAYGSSLKWLLDLRLAFEAAGDGAGSPGELADRAVESGSAAACGLVLGLVVLAAGGGAAAPYREACLARIPAWRRPVIRALARPELLLGAGGWLREKWPNYAMKVWLTDGWGGRAAAVARAVGFKVDLERTKGRGGT